MQYQTNYPYATTSQQYGAISHPREEQRLRQHEYSQALAQQVAQQKQRERGMDQPYGRHNGGFPNPPQQTFSQSRQEAPAFEPVERGYFDGLGRNKPQSSRNSFARGQTQLHHRLPGGPEPFDPLHNQPPVDNQGFQSGFGLPGGHQQHQVPQQSWQQQHAVHGDPVPPFAPGPNMQTGWSQQNPRQRSMSQARSSQFGPGQGIAEQPAAAPGGYGSYGSPPHSFQSQAEPAAHTGGRRQRTDLHDGGRGDSEDAEKLRRKLQQQHEMQLALERQIEEKRQQKLEAKRRQEEDDRREMERFEEDQRRQRAEQERLQEEKRRKAELEQQKANQAAAAVAAANQQARLQQQQKLHAQASQAQLPHPPHVQPLQQHVQPPSQLQQQPDRFPNAPSPNRSKNPFANSRAHLFEDPQPQRSPQRMPNNQYAYSNQSASPIRGAPPAFGHTFQQESNALGRVVDPTELRRQYDDMREELRRQKQLVDELRQAQAQIQQQQQQLSPRRAGSGNIPTLLDLEKLRSELRGELAYREQLHRQEFASLKREQQQERSPEHSPRPYRSTTNSLEVPVRAAPSNFAHTSHHPALEPHHDPRQLQRDVTVRQQQAGFAHLNRSEDAPIDASLISLRGESKFVYLNERVGDVGTTGQVGVIREEDADARDDRRESIKVKAPQTRRSMQRSLQRSPRVYQSIQESLERSPAKASVMITNVSPSSSRREETSTDSEDDALDFVVAGVASSPSHRPSQDSSSSPASRGRRAAASSHRYSQLPPSLSSSSLPTQNYGKWRLESLNDDDLEESLDGEQLEALFQRNVRRHEILLGFQTKAQGQSHHSVQQEGGGAPHAKVAWAELHQQLEKNRRVSIRSERRKVSTTSTSGSSGSNQEQTLDHDDEAALVASSKWMPSSLSLPTKNKQLDERT
ncbi:hypothetical protein PHYPSEUDO_012254 [Phytophthora pseudosyringae]|uniref:Uncharacterized protein n=1 Tax=Phytophthora pseudosyringae TaxID=221518 RepID=A0A8T1V701_9STRA|nr:hypothetical protein PHYPSEUDO_012254 [Phytophthora pseudosyringae]